MRTVSELTGEVPAHGNANVFSRRSIGRTAFHEQHPWLFRWPPLLFTLFWVTDTARWGPQGHWPAFALFYALFLVAFIRVFADGERFPRLWLAVLFVLGYVYVPFNENAAGEFVFPVVMSVFFLRQPKLSAALARFAVIEVVAAAAVFVELKLMHAHSGIATNVIFYMVAIGFMNFAYSRHILASEQLEQANAEIEHLAQVAERERIARDLHDLLGHTLTVIVLKSDIANRLFEIEPAIAHREIAEVEATARTALAEVREAVAGYRGEGLPAEVARARRALASAGVQLTTDIDPLTAPSEESKVLCIVLREAVTNVIRHAEATACRLELHGSGNSLSLVIEDNGNGGSGIEGNGLRGMRERLNEVGGRLERTSVGGSGTRLQADVPVTDPGTSIDRTSPAPNEITKLAQPANPAMVQL